MLWDFNEKIYTYLQKSKVLNGIWQEIVCHFQGKVWQCNIPYCEKLMGKLREMELDKKKGCMWICQKYVNFLDFVILNNRVLLETPTFWDIWNMLTLTMGYWWQASFQMFFIFHIMGCCWYKLLWELYGNGDTNSGISVAIVF